MSKKERTLPQELGIENDNEIIDQCLMWQIGDGDISDILKKIMCSDYDSKQMLYAAYVVGKMQNASKEHINDMITYLSMKNLKKLIDEANK